MDEPFFPLLWVLPIVTSSCGAIGYILLGRQKFLLADKNPVFGESTPEMLTLCTFDDSVTAGVAKSFLEANDIRCDVADENAHLYTPGNAVPIRLLVPKDQIQDALKLLRRMPEGTESSPQDR